MAQRLSEIVAHDLRLAAVQRAEKIVVMDRGWEMAPAWVGSLVMAWKTQKYLGMGLELMGLAWMIFLMTRNGVVLIIGFHGFGSC